MNADLTRLTLADAAAALKSLTITPVELTNACLVRIERHNSELNAFISVFAESALESARAAETEILAGRWLGPLHGIPIGIKDLIDIAGTPTTAGSAVYLNNVASEDAPVIKRLKAAGAILLGKLNLHEFAYGGSGMISHFGPARNPRNTEYMTGGSSSGSAAAVAGGLCLAALGTDTAGSIRLPAAYCGIVGFKPTYGSVSTEGVVPLAWSYDTVGPMTRTVEDSAILWGEIAEPRTRRRAESSPTKELRIGIPFRHFFEELDSEVEQAMSEALATIEKMVKSVKEIEFELESDRTIFQAEPYAYHCDLIRESPELYQPETLQRIQTGGSVTTVDYIRKKIALERLREHAVRIFDDVDLLMTPTAPVPPMTIARLEAEPEQLRPREMVMLRNTRPWSVLGLPTISVPCGQTKSGLPTGMQISAAPGCEQVVLSLALAYEQGTNWETKYARL